MTTTPVINDHDTVAMADDVTLKLHNTWNEARLAADVAKKAQADAAKALESSMDDAGTDVLISPETGKALARFGWTSPKPVLDQDAAVAALVAAGIPVPMRTPDAVLRFTVQKP